MARYGTPVVRPCRKDAPAGTGSALHPSLCSPPPPCPEETDCELLARTPTECRTTNTEDGSIEARQTKYLPPNTSMNLTSGMSRSHVRSSVRRSICSSVCPSVRPSVRPTARRSVGPSAHPSARLLCTHRIGASMANQASVSGAAAVRHAAVLGGQG